MMELLVSVLSASHFWLRGFVLENVQCQWGFVINQAKFIFYQWKSAVYLQSCKITNSTIRQISESLNTDADVKVNF